MKTKEIHIKYNYETDPDEVLERSLAALLSMWKYVWIHSTDTKREHSGGYIREMKFER